MHKPCEIVNYAENFFPPTHSSRLLWLNIGKLTHAGGPGSNPGQAELWRLVTLKPLKLQQCTLHFWKPLIFFYLNKRVQEHSCMYIYDMQLEITIGLLHKIVFDWFILSTAVHPIFGPGYQSTSDFCKPTYLSISTG